nr:unnamed protein product [Spirometra erinaceieuropaei]
MQRRTDLFAAAYDNFGLLLNAEKVLVMRQPPPNAAYTSPHINVIGVHLQAVDTFVILDNTHSRSTKIHDEVACRNPKASQAFGRL